MQHSSIIIASKTMVVVEGVSRKLDPDTNIWEVSALFWRIGLEV